VIAATEALALEPQAQSLADLRAASATPVSLEVALQAGQGVPIGVSMDVPVLAPDSVAAGREFFEQYGDLFRLGPDVALVPQRVSAPGIGASGSDLVSFSQTYKGIPVWGSRISLLVTPSPTGGPSRVRLATGALLSGRGDVQIGTIPTLSAAQATELAREYLGGSGAPLAAEPVLEIFDPRLGGNDAPDAAPPSLVYVLTLLGAAPTEVLVDATTGSILLSHSLVRDGYRLDLRDAAGAPPDASSCYDDGPTFAGDEDGLIAAYLNDPESAQAWWYAAWSYAYFAGALGRDSFDNDGAELSVFVHAGVANATWRSGCHEIAFANGWMSFDVMAHEFTHGVVREEADLIYAGEPGALDESYADTFAALADAQDWLIAEDRSSGGGAIRSLADPPMFTDPDEDSEYVISAPPCDANNDFCRVHTNSGIFNKMHYLMAQGDTFKGRTTVGMGRPKLGLLAYLSLHALPPNSSLPQAAGVTRVNALYLRDHALFDDQDLCDVDNARAAVGYGFGDTDCDGISDIGDDSDGDGFMDLLDNCDNKSNTSQLDTDMDGVGDACDDSDGDGIADAYDNCPGVYNPYPQWDQDMDGVGDLCDPDRDGDGVADSVDNCDFDPNPGQEDGNSNGEGDACDPDTDGDGYWDFSAPQDNCTFVANSSQTDADADGLGDACDLCPNTADNSNAYTVPPCLNPGDPSCPDPVPYQPDSDGDGIPNACETINFGVAGMLLGFSPWNPTRPIRPDGETREASIVLPPGAAGAEFQVPLAMCDPAAPFQRAELAELQFTGLDARIDARVVDDRGRRVARAVQPVGSPARGLRFRPRCERRYYVQFELDPALGGGDDFQLAARRTSAAVPNPWRAPSGGPPAQPPAPVADFDMDGLADSIDSCPTMYEPNAADTDMDGVAQICDTCALTANPAFTGIAPGLTFVSRQWDGDGDGRGNRCDFDYDNVGAVVSATDFNQMKLSVGALRSALCGASPSNIPCAAFDHDESGLVITSTDFNLTKAAVGKVVSTTHPKCAACAPPFSLPVASGMATPGRPVCTGPYCTY
jgi:Zn-dependent metalloprotease